MGKNLKGGYQVIDLRNIDLTLTTEAQDITDSEVLQQLSTLRDYIEPSHNYVKPLKRKLKPILISIRDKKSDEEQESSIWANLSLIDDELSFKIEAVVNSSPLKVLQINVVFELVTEEDGSTHYEIDTATVLLTNTITISSGSISGDLDVTGDSSVGGDLDVTGSITGASIIEIMSGYSFTPKENTEQVTLDYKYAGVVKTGNKITFALFVEYTPLATGSGNDSLGYFTIPQDIANKLVAYTAGTLTRALDMRIVGLFTSGSAYKQSYFRAVKGATPDTNTVEFNIGRSGLTANQAYLLRIECTFLLSDNLIPQQSQE